MSGPQTIVFWSDFKNIYFRINSNILSSETNKKTLKQMFYYKIG